MLFITKKKFEETLWKEVDRRDAERRLHEDVWKLMDDVQQLKFRIECLEHPADMVKVEPTTETTVAPPPPSMEV